MTSTRDTKHDNRRADTMNTKTSNTKTSDRVDRIPARPADEHHRNQAAASDQAAASANRSRGGAGAATALKIFFAIVAIVAIGLLVARFLVDIGV